MANKPPYNKFQFSGLIKEKKKTWTHFPQKYPSRGSCNCGLNHYSLTDYWTCGRHNPDWIDQHPEPWVSTWFIQKGTGVAFSVDVCIYCKEIEYRKDKNDLNVPMGVHKEDCPTMMDRSPSPQPKFSIGRLDLLRRGFSNPYTVGGMRSGAFAGSEQYRKDQAKLEKDKREKAEKEKERQKAILEAIDKKFEEWHNSWEHYIKLGEGIVFSYNFHDYHEASQPRVVWKRPIIIELKVEGIEGDNTKRLNLIDTTVVHTPTGSAVAHKDKVDYIYISDDWSCIEHAMEDEAEYHALMVEMVYGGDLPFSERYTQKPLQLILENKKDIIKLQKDSFGKNYLDLKDIFYHFRTSEPINNLSWSGYWTSIENDLKSFDKKFKTSTENKLKTIKAKIDRMVVGEGEEKIRQEDILKEINGLIDPTKSPRARKGYFDEAYKITSYGDNLSLKQLTIDLSSFMVGGNSIPFDKFNLLSQGTIKLHQFPELESLTINISYLDAHQSYSFEKLDLADTAPNLKRLDCNEAEKLTEIVVGEKKQLKFLDLRWTNLTKLDLSKTTLIKADYSNPDIFPKRDSVSDELVDPFILVGGVPKLSIENIKWGQKGEPKKSLEEKKKDFETLIKNRMGWLVSELNKVDTDNIDEALLEKEWEKADHEELQHLRDKKWTVLLNEVDKEGTGSDKHLEDCKSIIIGSFTHFVLKTFVDKSDNHEHRKILTDYMDKYKNANDEIYYYIMREEINEFLKEPKVYFFEKGEDYYEFTNFYQGEGSKIDVGAITSIKPNGDLEFSVLWEPQEAESSEIAYQYLKFKYSGHQDIADQIIAQNTSEKAFELANKDENKAKISPNWNKIKVKVMEWILDAKFTKTEILKEVLLRTDKKELINDNPNDNFWGNGNDGKGANELGKALMRLREREREREPLT